jgi:NADPH:quinone reductase-like Zn-dependent oxidoreductase
MLVISTCSTNNIQFLKNLGADQVIDYTKECIELKVQDVDVVFDPKSYIYENITIHSDILKKGKQL